MHFDYCNDTFIWFKAGRNSKFWGEIMKSTDAFHSDETMKS